MTTSHTSNKPASKEQARRVQALSVEAIEEVLENNTEFTHETLEVILANDESYRREYATRFTAFLKSFANRMLGIITPLRAQNTGLIPTNMTVQSDVLEGDIDLGNLDYSICPVQDSDNGSVNSYTLFERAKQVRAHGSLGFAAGLLEIQQTGRDIFPIESRGQHCFIMPLTVLLGGLGVVPHIACFQWHMESQSWVLDFFRLNLGVDCDTRFVCPRE